MTDEGSTNGTFVNGQRIELRRAIRLEDGDRIQLGTGVILKLVHLDPSDERFQHEMFERTVRDGMTGLYNRAYFLNQVGGLAARHETQGIGLAILMMDVDHFKQINDRYGHLAGDCVLREIALVIRESTRSRGPGRPVRRRGVRGGAAGLRAGPRDRAGRADPVERGKPDDPGRPEEIHVTDQHRPGRSAPRTSRNELALIEAADQALYQAKADGRNRVVLGRSSPSRRIPEDPIG